MTAAVDHAFEAVQLLVMALLIFAGCCWARAQVRESAQLRRQLEARVCPVIATRDGLVLLDCAGEIAW